MSGYLFAQFIVPYPCMTMHMHFRNLCNVSNQSAFFKNMRGTRCRMRRSTQYNPLHRTIHPRFHSFNKNSTRFFERRWNVEIREALLSEIIRQMEFCQANMLSCHCIGDVGIVPIHVHIRIEQATASLYPFAAMRKSSLRYPSPASSRSFSRMRSSAIPICSLPRPAKSSRTCFS